jgi:hypothetical protein
MFTPLARCGGTNVVEGAGGVAGGEGVELAAYVGGNALGSGEGTHACSLRRKHSAQSTRKALTRTLPGKRSREP